MKTQTALTIQTQLANLKAKVKKKEKLLSKKRRTAAVSERSQKRKDSERRQFLAGAYVLAALEKTGDQASKLKIGEQSLEQWLTRDADRVLFDLEVVRQEITGVADGQSTSGAADQTPPLDVPIGMNGECTYGDE